METKFTKSPWTQNTTDEFMELSGLAITDMNNRLIATVSHDLSELTMEEYEGNANLIVYAPDLFQSLYQAVTVYEQSKELPTNFLELWYPAAKAAIKKVTE